MSKFRGLTYPLQVTEKGHLVTSTDLSLVEENIISVLETRPFERVMRADYGFNPKIFDTLEPNAINARIWRAVTTQVPSIETLEVDGKVSTIDNGLYQVQLRYVVDGQTAPPLDLTLNM